MLETEASLKPVEENGNPLEKSTAVLESNIHLMQSLYAGAGNAVAGALETFKVFKPEIARLDGRADEIKQSIGDMDSGIKVIKVGRDALISSLSLSHDSTPPHA